MFRRVTFGLVCMAMAASSPVHAAAVHSGASLLSIQVSHGIGDFVEPLASAGYLPIQDHSEWGLRGEYWKLVGDDFAFTLSGGAAWSSETQTPSFNAPPDSPDYVYTQKSWHVRVGGDRVANLGERAALYFGPGIEYWTGSAAYENIFIDGKVEGAPSHRLSLYGRIGGLMSIGSSWALTGHVEHRIGYATAKEAGAEAIWWPSGWDAASGIVFLFGGKE